MERSERGRPWHGTSKDDSLKMKIEVVVLVGLYGIWEGGVRCGGSAGSARSRTPACAPVAVLHAVRRVLEACSGVYGTGR